MNFARVTNTEIRERERKKKRKNARFLWMAKSNAQRNNKATELATTARVECSAQSACIGEFLPYIYVCCALFGSSHSIA